MENKIVLTLGKNGWNAEWFGYEREEVIDLFSTAVLPTPFTAQADHMMVKSEIEKLNPGYIVVIA